MDAYESCTDEGDLCKCKFCFVFTTKELALYGLWDDRRYTPTGGCGIDFGTEANRPSRRLRESEFTCSVSMGGLPTNLAARLNRLAEEGFCCPRAIVPLQRSAWCLPVVRHACLSPQPHPTRRASPESGCEFPDLTTVRQVATCISALKQSYQPG
jgi:hypothetical protein